MAARSAGPLLLAAVLLAGCGGHEQSAAEKAAMNARFADLENSMTTVVYGAQPVDQEYLRTLTEQYVAATRKYAGDLGDGEVKRRPAEKEVLLQPWCVLCVELLDREWQRH